MAYLQLSHVFLVSLLILNLSRIMARPRDLFSWQIQTTSRILYMISYLLMANYLNRVSSLKNSNHISRANLDVLQ